jgi:hypothetical protein
LQEKTTTDPEGNACFDFKPQAGRSYCVSIDVTAARKVNLATSQQSAKCIIASRLQKSLALLPVTKWQSVSGTVMVEKSSLFSRAERLKGADVELLQVVSGAARPSSPLPLHSAHLRTEALAPSHAVINNHPPPGQRGWSRSSHTLLPSLPGSGLPSTCSGQLSKYDSLHPSAESMQPVRA